MTDPRVPFRVPRPGEPAPEDIAACWMRLSFRQKARVTEAANRRGLLIHDYIRERFSVCSAALFSRRTATGSA